MAAENDGKGEMRGQVGTRNLNISTDPTVSDITPLHAGSNTNRLVFTYTAYEGSDDTAVGYDMRDGMIRIAIPDGWTVPDRVYVEEYDGGGDTPLYDTQAGTQVVEDADLVKRVEVEPNKYIKVKLSGELWGKQTGQLAVNRQIYIEFREVVTPVPPRLTEQVDTVNGVPIYAYKYEFSSSSMARNGTLIRLADANQPQIGVGNIHGNKGVADSRDTLDRKVVITPKQAFEDDTNTKFTIEFTAPGPIYRGTLTITPDAGVAPSIGPGANADGATQADVYMVRASSGAAVALTDGTVTTTPIALTLTNIDKDQKVTVTYTRKAALDLQDTPTASSFTAGMTLPNLVLDTTNIITDVTPPTVEGGQVRPVRGSGRMELTPTAVEAGSRRVNITMTYTADTDLENQSLGIIPKGIVIDPTNENMRLQTTNSAGYGYVSSSMPDIRELDDGSGRWGWHSIDLDKNKSITVTIHRVDIESEAKEYPWDIEMGGLGYVLLGQAQVESPPILSVTKTSGDAVKFEVVGQDTFAAGSMQTIQLRFTAQGTPIRGGRVSFTIPEALGSAPTAAEAVGRVTAGVSAGKLEDKQPTVSGRTVNVAIKNMDVGDSVLITYGSTDKKADHKALIHYVAGEVKIRGTFRSSDGASTRTAEGEAVLTIGNVEDGTGAAVLSPATVEAGSVRGNAIEVVFTVYGTMDGGKVVLERPDGWGDMQNTDPTKRNYVRVTSRPSGGVASLDVAANQVIVTIGKLAQNGAIRFSYGGGTAGDANGIAVETEPKIAIFMIKSDGDGDGVFKPVAPPADDSGKHTGRNAIRNPDALGQLYSESENSRITVGAGILRVKVTSALDGTGTVTVDKTEVRAADDDVALTFTYTPNQTIKDGELRFTVPSSWSKPQVEEIGSPGFIEVDPKQGADLGIATDDDKFTVIVPIFSVDKNQMIEIRYGATDTGRAVASPVIGTAAFKIAIKGSADGTSTNLRSDQPTVTVGPQASGKGKAVVAVTGDALHAGDMDREITVTYTAAGQMVAGSVQLTVPAGWSAPTANNLTVMAGMDAMTATFDGQMATVDGVNLMAGGQVKFSYTGDVTPDPTVEPGETSFVVSVNGGDTGDTFAAVSGEDTMLTVDVGQARPGSGMGTVSPKIVEAGATGVNIQFTYTAAGWTDAPREFRVQVPRGWTAPSNAVSSANNKGTYTVVHRHLGAVTTTSVEKLDPIGRDMVARVKQGGLEVIAGDEIIFTYENADAPATPEVSNFVLVFDQEPIADSVMVRVQDSTPSMLLLESAGTVSADEGALPLGITVGLRDADGVAVAMENDVAVTLVSSSTTGAFSMMAGEAGTESATVTIAGGDVSAMVYYTDSTGGTATINATAPGLTSASQEITVTAAAVAPDAVAITSDVMVDPALAMAGGEVTVSVMGTAGQMAMFSVGSIVTDNAMMEDAAGAYSESFMVVADQHADGTYDVTVNVGTASAMGSLTIDNTAPTVTVTAPESAANGDTVMISATVTDASAISSVMADVSMLDSTQTDPVALTMGDDGYSASITISADNENANGSKTVTVTAMDAAGNSGMGEATVELKNTLSYTSMIPAGISLYHVPLDVADIETVEDLKMKLGDAVNLVIVYDHATGSWNSRSDDVAITADLGVVLSMASATMLTLEGEAWDDGVSMISLQAGPNLVGLPVNDPRVTNVSDIAGLFDEGVVLTITVSTDAGFELVSDTMDPAVMGDAAYLVTASADGDATLLGDGWSYSMAGAAPIALAGYSVDGQTPVLDVQGAVVDEITGLAKEGFRVKVKNLSTKASLSKVTSAETAVRSETRDGYNMTFVDLKAGNAARIGDILEISADSLSPLIGVKPVRHVVTANDVKSGILELEDLIAYEIPAETELLRNYPNPFNPETWIPYRLAEDAFVTLTIYDGAGRVVRTLDVGYRIAGVYESRSKAIHWDGRNEVEEQVASDLYFYHLSAGDFSATRKMVILK